MNEVQNYKFLGYQNVWADGKEPKEYRDCKEAGHETETRNNFQTCEHTYICHQCQTYYKIDSSD